jgi:hypothetical protein
MPLKRARLSDICGISISQPLMSRNFLSSGTYFAKQFPSAAVGERIVRQVPCRYEIIERLRRLVFIERVLIGERTHHEQILAPNDLFVVMMKRARDNNQNNDRNSSTQRQRLSGHFSAYLGEEKLFSRWYRRANGQLLAITSDDHGTNAPLSAPTRLEITNLCPALYETFMPRVL